MKSYKVIICKVKESEAIMNRMAAESWKVIAVTPNNAMGYGVIITFERDL